MNSDFIVATHALVALYHHKTDILSSETLAENVCTNPVRIRRVMAQLKKAGLVETRMGCAGGGYGYPADKSITLEQVAAALGARFAETAWRSGDPHQACRIASGMAGYMDGLYEQLDALCRRRLGTITIADVESDLFKQPRGGKKEEDGV